MFPKCRGSKKSESQAIGKPGETVEAVVLGLNTAERKLSLGLKQALGDPWADAKKKVSLRLGSRRSNFQHHQIWAFVQVAEGIEGMIHVSDISAEKRINHPQDVLKTGQTVKSTSAELDVESAGSS